MTTNRKTDYFPNLDGLRFLAFSLVFLQHGFHTVIVALAPPSAVWNYVKVALFERGGEGVSFFFVLSGFLITYLLLVEVRDNGSINVPYFYLRRTLRIWPLYFLVIIFAVLVYPAIKPILGAGPATAPDRSVIGYFLFLSNFQVLSHQQAQVFETAMSAVTWSVSIEEQFYLVWPLLFLAIPRRRHVALFPVVILLSLGFRIWHWDDATVRYFHTFAVASDLALGGMGAYFAVNSKALRDWFAALDRRWIVAAYLIGGLLFATAPLVPSLHTPRLLLPAFYLFIILEQNYATRSLFKMSAFRRVSALGIYTYGLYLLHPIALTLLDIGNVMSPIESAIRSFLALGASFAMAGVSYHFFEFPFLRLKSRFSAHGASALEPKGTPAETVAILGRR